MEGKKSGKKILILTVCIVLLAAAGIGGFFFVRTLLNQNSYQESISTAEKYVADGNLEQAVVAYQNAIEVQPDKDGGYLGLAEVYLQQEEVSSAKVVLKKGYLKTESEKIRYMLDGIEDGSLLTAAAAEKDIKETTLESSGKFGWDVSFLQKLENFTYQDFQAEFGSNPEVVKVAKGELEVVHPDLSAICYYSNTPEYDDIVDDRRDRPDETGMPERVTLDTLDLLFINFTGTVTLDQLRSISSSQVDPIVKDEMTYVELKTSSLVIRIETDEQGNVVSDQAWNEIILTEANKNRERTGILAGVVVNAVTGESVEDAVLEFEGRSGGTASETAETAQDGSFSVELEPGKYDITITCDGYMEEIFEFEMQEGRNYIGEQFIISPSLAEGTARIVLEWGAEPRDLDSYLTGVNDRGDEVFVSFYRKIFSSGGDTVAELDVDDTNGYGPETITLYDLNGVYRYVVVDYMTTNTLQQYGATVKVYLPGQSPVTITVEPGAGIQNIWEVFELDHGELNILNRAGDDDSLMPGNK